MARYRTRRHYVEAQQWRGWEEGPAPAKALGIRPHRWNAALGYIWMNDEEQYIAPADWIVVDADGDRSIMKDADFLRLYEPDDEGENDA